MAASEDAVVQAINDLTRVMIALSDRFGSRSEAVRKMDELSIPPARIGAILAMPTKDVSSILSQEKRRRTKKGKSGE